MASEQSTLVTNLRKVITLIDRLRDAGLNKFISLPRIADLGSQSAGKSSLIEQIVGLDFLPRGEGTVTRRPLELRLVYVPKEKLSQPYGIFEEIPGQKFSDFQVVKANIDRLTDSVAGNKKGIVDKPIVLTIFSPTCPDLTIIDLPGITKIPIKGSDQTADVEKITKEMATRYCRDPKTIILCVIPANADITTSDGLMLARQLDPQGVRTIGVITKIDIMDRGTDAKRLLNGDDVALRLGYVGVKCRSQADINDKKPVLQALEDERKYFAQSPVYSSMPQTLLGTKSLTNKLTDVLYTHIRACLPEIIAEIQKQINEKEARLKELGPGLPEDDTERMKLLWRIINDFSTAFKNSINGSYDKLSSFDKGRLPAGHRIRLVLSDLYADLRSSKPTDKYTDMDIKHAIIKHEGDDTIPGFPNLDAFLYLLVPLLELLKEPAFECVNEIYHILEEIAASTLNKIISKAPALKDELQESILNHFKDERESCKEKIEKVIDSEIGYIFTNDIEYLTSRANQNSKSAQEDNKKNPVPIPAKNPSLFGNNDNSRASGDPVVHELRYRVDDYFSLVMRGIKDSIPKMIGYFLVKASQNKLQQTLFEATSKSERYFTLMAEPSHLVEERKALAAAVETLKTSIKMIRRDPDFSTFFNQADKLIAKEQQNQKNLQNSDSKQQNPTLSTQNSLNQQNSNSNPNLQNQQSRPGHSVNNSFGDIKVGGPNQNPNNSFSGPSGGNRNNIFPPNKMPGGPINNGNSPAVNTNIPGINGNNNNNFNNNPFSNASLPNVNNPQNSKNNPNQFAIQQNQPIQPVQSGPLNQNMNNNQQKAAATNQLFGVRYQGNQGAPQNPNVPPPNPQNQNPLANKVVDKAVDKAFESPAFQQGMTNAASTGAKQAFGNNAAGEMAGNLAGKAVQNQAVQDAMKNQAKEQGKAQVEQKTSKLNFWS